jgi:hypothetical protein
MLRWDCDLLQSCDLALEIEQFTVQGIILLRGLCGHFRQSLTKVVRPPKKIEGKRRRAQNYQP